MNQLCYELLNGTLTWNEPAPANDNWRVTVTNNLPIPVCMSLIPNAINTTASGFPVTMNPHAMCGIGGDDQGPGYYVLTVAATGALIDVLAIGPEQSPAISVTSAILNVPNDIGPVPVPSSPVVQPDSAARIPNSTIIVPPDSPRVLVGCGTTPNGNYITREQYWERQSDSVCLAGHEARTVSFTVSQGKQQTSSETSTVTASVDSSISGGWGAVSASISASLSSNSTSFQQVMVTEETSTFVSHTIENPHEYPVAFLRWQLHDVITVFSAANNLPQSTIVMAESPSIVLGPYWVSPTQTPNPSPEALKARGSGLFNYK